VAFALLLNADRARDAGKTSAKKQVFDAVLRPVLEPQSEEFWPVCVRRRRSSSSV